jgi:L-cysteine S-thiosulfotransferase
VYPVGRVSQPISGKPRDRWRNPPPANRLWIGGLRYANPPYWCAIFLAAIALFTYPAQSEDMLRPYRVVGDAIVDSLTGAKGEAQRGRSIVLNRQVGLCLLCHSGPYPEEKFQGTLAPDLTGTGSRWSEGQLRLRMVDASRLYPNTIMPPYYRVDGLVRVAPAFAGKSILTAEEIEDVVAYLVTLRDEPKR